MRPRYNAETTAEEVAASWTARIANKTVLVTGVTAGGLGAEFAIVVARHKPRLIILASRSKAKADHTARDIAAVAPDVQTRFLELDLSSQVQIRKAAAQVNAYREGIDVLVNNAGILSAPYRQTEDGVESLFGICHIGHFLFTNLIVPKLNPNSRVVSVASDGYMLSPVRFEDWHFDVSSPPCLSIERRSNVILISRVIFRTARTLTHGLRTARLKLPTFCSRSLWRRS